MADTVHLKGRVSERNKTVMYALNRGENSGYFGKALVSPVDGYFVITPVGNFKLKFDLGPRA